MNFPRFFLAAGLLTVLPSFGMMVIRDQQGYAVHDGKKIRRVPFYDTDETLRRFNPETFKRFVEVGGRVQTSRLSNGDYFLRDGSGLKGGLLVAGAVVGAVVRVGLYGGYAIGWGVAAATTPGGATAGWTLLPSALTYIEGAANVVSAAATVCPFLP